VLAIEGVTGQVWWVQQRPGINIFTVAYGYPNIGAQDTTICPGITGPDSDFGMVPTYKQEVMAPSR
jgi:hypothetical protein